MSPGRHRSLALPERVTLTAMLMLAAWLLLDNDTLWRWNNIIYDAQLNFWSRPADDDIIIVAIDDDSLQQLGRWPWPRSTHAQLIDVLNEDGASLISLDIIFAEADQGNPFADVLLSRALQKHRNVLLPVYMSQGSDGRPPLEALPIPEFARFAAALGHVHVELDRDGIARRVFLYEGIGSAYWPHLALAMLQQDKQQRLLRLPEKTPAPKTPDQRWQREAPRLIPYAGPPGHFARIAYSRVLNRDFPPGTFDGKYVLVGTTAFGLGDALPTPVSAQSHAMPGVELNANILDALLNGISITPVSHTPLLLFTLLFAALPMLVYPYLIPRHSLLTAVVLLGAVLLGSAALLWLFQLWLPPAVAGLMIAISYPLWSWRRLEHAMRFLDAELERLDRQRRKFALGKPQPLKAAMRFVSDILPIHGWVLQNRHGEVLLQDGTPPRSPRGQLQDDGWTFFQYDCWAHLPYRGEACKLGLSLHIDTELSTTERRLLDRLLWQFHHRDKQQTRLKSDVLQARIQQVQQASEQISELRRFVDDGMSHMADGVIVTDNVGQVLMNNSRAGWYLQGDDDASLQGLSMLQCLQPVLMPGGAQWQPVLRKTLLQQEHFITQARHRDGRELMVQLAPLRGPQNDADGVIVNLSDIQLLKASERKRDEMLNFLSHDIRSPLASMMALIELAQNKPADQIAELLQRMQGYTEKTLHMAEQFLQLSRVKSSEELPFCDMDFNTVALNAVEQMWWQAQQKHVELHHEFKQESLWIQGEPDLLERAIVNLLANAIKYSAAGTRVLITTWMDKEMVHCSVQDEGPGIARDDMPHLFELFKRVRRDDGQGKTGIGLGLAFVDAVSQRHRGRIEVESQPGRGSTFMLSLPLAQHGTATPSANADRQAQ